VARLTAPIFQPLLTDDRQAARSVSVLESLRAVTAFVVVPPFDGFDAADHGFLVGEMVITRWAFLRRSGDFRLRGKCRRTSSHGRSITKDPGPLFSALAFRRAHAKYGRTRRTRNICRRVAVSWARPRRSCCRNLGKGAQSARRSASSATRENDGVSQDGPGSLSETRQITSTVGTKGQDLRGCCDRTGRKTSARITSPRN